MNYKPLTIKELLEKVDNGQLILPAIQRSFVWTGTNRIAGLFDSLMQDFPIGAFMWWRLNEQNYQDYPYYEFLKEYHQTPHHTQAFNTLQSEKKAFDTDEPIWAILDGQQRINAIYLALKGEMKYKTKSGGHWKNHHNFNAFHLCINLLHDVEDFPYEITFIKDTEVDKSKYNILWFKVSDVMDFGSKEKIEPWIENKATELPDEAKESLSDPEKKAEAIKTLNRLYEVIFEDKNLFYYEVNKEELDEVVEIFIRVNNGGIALNKSQLILSTITARWIDARNKFDDLKKELGKKGLEVPNEFILSTALYCCDLTSKVDLKSFKTASIDKIRDNWGAIHHAITASVDFIDNTGYEKHFLRYRDTLLPIAYFIFKGGDVKKSHKDLKQYFVVSQVKEIFQKNKRTILNRIREQLRESAETDNGKVYQLKSTIFSYDDLVNIPYLTRNKSFAVNEEAIIELVETHIEESYWILKFLFQRNITYGIKYQKDHIHANVNFYDGSTLHKLKETHPEINIEDWKYKRDLLPNVQLIEGEANNKKRSKSLTKWLSTFDDKTKQQIINDNLLPNTDYELANFETFYNERKELLKKRIKLVFEI
jgi:hypothetical protein